MAALQEAPVLADSTNKRADAAEAEAKPAAKRKAAEEPAGGPDGAGAGHEEGGDEHGDSSGGWAGGSKWAKHGMGDPAALAFIPKVPPRSVAPKKIKLSMAQEALVNSGGHLDAADYGPKDTILWPPMCAELFREKSRTQDKKFGSRFMRYWFDEHEGMPVEPPTAPKSGYSLFVIDRRREVSQERTFNNKKDMKAIGIEWRDLPDDGEIKTKYEGMIGEMRAEQARRMEAWQAAMAAWREAKRARVGAETDRKNPVCACKFCVGDDEPGEPSD